MILNIGKGKLLPYVLILKKGLIVNMLIEKLDKKRRLQNCCKMHSKEDRRLLPDLDLKKYHDKN